VIVQKEDVLLLCHRRLFVEDQPRFFIGKVDNCEDGLILISGYAWVKDRITGELSSKADMRTKVVSLVSGTILVYQLPRDINITTLMIEPGEQQQILLMDGHGFSMDISDHR
jgi:hypothetical protein